VQPFRLDRRQVETRDQDHGYTAEQQAFDGGLMDRFVETVGRAATTRAPTTTPTAGFAPTVAFETIDYAVTTTLVAKGFGIAVVPRLAWPSDDVAVARLAVAESPRSRGDRDMSAARHRHPIHGP
jgi:DNA-binding transcriptional LysR family regulator